MHLERTLSYAKASQLAHYLIDVTQAFGDFYRECRVLGERRELTARGSCSSRPRAGSSGADFRFWACRCLRKCSSGFGSAGSVSV